MSNNSLLFQFQESARKSTRKIPPKIKKKAEPKPKKKREKKKTPAEIDAENETPVNVIAVDYLFLWLLPWIAMDCRRSITFFLNRHT